jgi:hypothetical protein
MRALVRPTTSGVLVWNCFLVTNSMETPELGARSRLFLAIEIIDLRVWCVELLEMGMA